MSYVIAYIGNHGYDNEEPLMRAFFAATGPAFRKNVSIESLSNIDIFALMTYMLRLDTSLLTVKPNSTLHQISNILTEQSTCKIRDTRTRDILTYFSPRNDQVIPSQRFNMH